MCSSTCSAQRSLVVIRIAGESGPCSAWDEQVDGDEERVGLVVGDDQDLGRARRTGRCPTSPKS